MRSLHGTIIIMGVFAARKVKKVKLGYIVVRSKA